MSEPKILTLRIIGRTLLLGALCAALTAASGFFVFSILGPVNLEERAYLSVAAATLFGFVGFCVSSVMVLRRAGIRGRGVALGFLAVFGCLMMVISTAGSLYFDSAVVPLNPNGPAPLLSFEILPPTGLLNPSEVTVSLDTETSSANATLQAGETNGAILGSVELREKISARLIVFRTKDNQVRIFRLALPDDPRTPEYWVWSEWKRADFQDQGAESNFPQPVTADPDYRIRVRVQESPPQQP